MRRVTKIVVSPEHVVSRQVFTNEDMNSRTIHTLQRLNQVGMPYRIYGALLPVFLFAENTIAYTLLDWQNTRPLKGCSGCSHADPRFSLKEAHLTQQQLRDSYRYGTNLKRTHLQTISLASPTSSLTTVLGGRCERSVFHRKDDPQRVYY